MNEPVVIEFRGEPVAKGRGRVSIGRGRPIVYTPAKTRKYEAALRYAAVQAMGDRRAFSGAVRMDVTAFLPIPTTWSKKKKSLALTQQILPTTKPDWDNYGKLACDALNTIVFLDDKQVAWGIVQKFYSDTPSLRIEVTSLDLEP